MRRFAIYFTPGPDNPLTQAAAAWLGRNVHTGEFINQQLVPGMSKERFWQLTGTPRHYGFHATLKPPFHLTREYSVKHLFTRLEEYVATTTAFPLPPLQVGFLENFFCLMPAERCARLEQLAGQVVTLFDEFRVPADEDELQKRRSAGLTPMQEQMLVCWGYPYVLQEFRFHLTLTGRINNGHEKEALAVELKRRFEPNLCSTVWFDALSVFEELNSSAMQVVASFPLRPAQ